MKIKKFEAEGVSEALRAIREELGPDAVIISTREITRHEAGVPLRRRVEVTAAVEFPPPSGKFNQKESSQRTEASERGANGATSKEHQDHERRRDGEAAGRLNRAMLVEGATQAPGDREQSKFDRIFQEVIPKIEKGEEIFSIREELKGIREAVSALQAPRQLDRSQFYGRLYEVCKDLKEVTGVQEEKKPFVDFHESFVRLYDRLLASGVDHQTAASLVRLMNEKIAPPEADKEDILKNYLEEVIKGMIQKISPHLPAEAAPAVMALIGPAGAGKTTTLAKLAARKVMSNQQVLLATLDTSRIGAVDQLNAFGKIIGAPVYAAASMSELQGMISRKKKGDFIFVDTPGRNYRNSRQLAELRGLAITGIPVETHLVLSAHTREEELDEMIDRFSSLPVDRLIFTKTDETRRFGHLLSMMRKKKKGISYLTTGQRVPEDIEAATPKRIVDLILKKEFKQREKEDVYAGVYGSGRESA